MHANRPIGIFDSGYGGLTVFKAIKEKMPQYNYVYLGDNARAPYGNRSFDTVYQYTLQAVEYLLKLGCPLIILACNTASAKALRSIQVKNLPIIGGRSRVLGVIRPTAEVIGTYTKTGAVGVLGTKGTIQSDTYKTEIRKFFPDVTVYQHACPMWVPLIENNEMGEEVADYYVKKDLKELLKQSEQIDTILLGCTHYPLLMDTIKKYLPEHIAVISQADIVADSLKDYLHRHPEIESQVAKEGQTTFYTTDDITDFNQQATTFFGAEVEAHHINI